MQHCLHVVARRACNVGSPPRSRRQSGVTTLLQVLNLLAELFDRDLHFDRDVGELQRRGFRAECVRLAQQFLDQEVEPLADLAAVLEQARDLVEVRAQARPR